MKGYKITEKNMICLNYQYELNKEFILNGRLKLCHSGFHFCQKLEDCFQYYDFFNGERLFEIEATGKIITKGNKSVTDKIIFIKEIFPTKEELYVIHSDPRFCNKGINNIGNHNTGNYNQGRFNEGNYNEGSWNFGDNNTGNDNKGNHNTGNDNKGNNNFGNDNKGNNNTGNYNKNNNII